MNSMKRMKLKTIPVLKSNIRTLPGTIASLVKQGLTADAELSRRILAESRKELERRGVSQL